MRRFVRILLLASAIAILAVLPFGRIQAPPAPAKPRIQLVDARFFVRGHECPTHVAHKACKELFP